MEKVFTERTWQRMRVQFNATNMINILHYSCYYYISYKTYSDDTKANEKQSWKHPNMITLNTKWLVIPASIKKIMAAIWAPTMYIL